MATGTVTATFNNKKVLSRSRVTSTRLYEFTVVSDASGDVLQQLPYIEGKLKEAYVMADEDDTPTTLFDVYLYNDNTTIKADLLGSAGVNMSISADNPITPLFGGAYKEIMLPRTGAWLVGDNMGVSLKLTLQLIVER
jgi:hypothetical protein